MSVIPHQMQQHLVAFGVNTTTPPSIDPQMIMQRADEVNTIQRMLTDAQASAVTVIGTPGAGKSTLAALLFNRLLLAKQSGLPAPYYLVWLGIGTYTTLPDIISAILSGVNMKDPSLFLQSPEEQITSLLQALRRPQGNALIVLDQFESLLHPETSQGVAGRGELPLFLDMLQKDLGTSRILLTSYNSPYDENKQPARVRTYLVSRISIPEGVALLQRLGVSGSPEELSLVWQRCSGHVFALLLCSALLRLSGIPLATLLNSPDYQALWAGEVVSHLITGIYHHLNPIQYALIRTLSLFSEPVPSRGIIMTIAGNDSANASSHAAFERELNRLVQANIVQPAFDRSGVACYTLHPLLRQYVLEHYLEGNLPRMGQELAALGIKLPETHPNGPDALQVAVATGHTQVATYYHFVAQERSPSPEQRKGLQDIEPLIATVRHLCMGRHWQSACDLLFAEGLHESMVQWGAWNTLIGLYTAMLPPFGNLNKHDEGRVRSHIGMLYGRLGEPQQCQAYFEQALTIQREIGDSKGEAATLANQGELLRMEEADDEARTKFEAALVLAQQQNDVRLQCVMLHNIGLLYHNARDLRQAFSYYLEALRLGYRTKESHNRGMILTNMGVLLYEEGLERESMAVLLAALEFRKEQQDPTVVLLENFLNALEEKIGVDNYTQLCRDALMVQKQVFSRFVNADMRQ